jgi:CBS domain-containing protein
VTIRNKSRCDDRRDYCWPTIFIRLGWIRHLPVLDENGQLTGIVTHRDLFRGVLAKALGYSERAQ